MVAKIIEKKMLEEPNISIFLHRGLTCVVKRMNWSGVLNGYVGVDKNNPLYEQSYWDYSGIEVHGGLTYSEMGLQSIEILDHLWFFGFDTNHFMDKTPIVNEYSLERKGVYRNFEYVKAETIKLAEQLIELSN